MFGIVGKWILFLKFLKLNSFLRFYILGMSLCSALKFGICDIYSMFYAILIQHLMQNLLRFYVNSIQYHHLITVETIIQLCPYIKELYVTYWKT